VAKRHHSVAQFALQLTVCIKDITQVYGCCVWFLYESSLLAGAVTLASVLEGLQLVSHKMEVLQGDVSEIREDTKRSQSSVTDSASTGRHFLDSHPIASGLSSILTVSRPVRPGQLQHRIHALQQPWDGATTEDSMQVQFLIS
jgi:hypothetical protein